MAYPQKLLTTGEDVVYDMRPHWRVLFYPALALLAIVFCTSFIVSWLPRDWGWARWAVLAIAVVLLVWWVVMPLIRWATSQYVITNRLTYWKNDLYARAVTHSAGDSIISDPAFDWGDQVFAIAGARGLHRSLVRSH